MMSQWARWRGNLLLRISSNSSFSRSSSCFSVSPIKSVKVVLERARLSLRSRCRFSFAREEEVESELLWDEFVRLTFGAGVLCHELRVGAACWAVIVNNWPPVGVGPGSSLLLRSLAGFRRETACLAFRQRRVAAGVGTCIPLFALSQLYMLNQGLSKASSLVVVPVFVATFVTCNAVGGGIFFDEFATLSPAQRTAYPLGLALLVAGVLVLAGRKEKAK